MATRNPLSRTRPSRNLPSSPLAGILLVTAGVGVLTVNDGLAKWLTEAYPVGQVIAIRGALMILFLLVWAAASGTFARLRVRDWRRQLLRGGLMTGSTVCFIFALSLLPIADAIAITFAGPLLTAALAVPLLGERVGPRRWIAIAVGLAAVLLMLRPGSGALQYAALLPLATALLGAFRDILTRSMAVTETALSVLLVSNVMITAAGFASPLWSDWQPVAPPAWGLFAAGALLVGVAQFLLIEAFRRAEAGLIAPFKYTSMVWAVLIGFLVWGEVPDLQTAAGALLVILSGLYVWQRERAGRRPRARQAGGAR